jgi:hypothetical protein
MQDNVLEIIKRRLENESEMAYSDFDEYAELYGFNESDDFFSSGLKRAIEIISAYIRLEKDENNIKQKEVQAIPLDKVKKARKEIENLTAWDECLVEMYDVLEILDKLIESE